MSTYNLILNAHANKLINAPQYNTEGGFAPTPFNQPVGSNNMTVTVPSNVMLVYYTDIYEMTPSCSGELKLTSKNPGNICYGNGQHPDYPGLVFYNDLLPQRIIQPGGMVPNMTLWSDDEGHFYSGLSICGQNGALLNIDSLPYRWSETVGSKTYKFKILLSEVLNYLETVNPTDNLYIHMLMCTGDIVGVVEGVDSGLVKPSGPFASSTGIGDITYGMRQMGTHPSFGGGSRTVKGGARIEVGQIWKIKKGVLFTNNFQYIKIIKERGDKCPGCWLVSYASDPESLTDEVAMIMFEDSIIRRYERFIVETEPPLTDSNNNNDIVNELKKVGGKRKHKKRRKKSKKRRKKSMRKRKPKRKKTRKQRK